MPPDQDDATGAAVMHSKTLALRPVIQLLFVIAIPVVVTALACHHWNIPQREVRRDRDAFNPPALAQELRRDRPEWVLVGNSMLGSRVTDEKKLEEAAGVRTKVIAKGGSQSAVWFLIFKQIIVESEAKPEWVTFFFRHTDLTWANFRVTGVQAEGIAQMDGPAQPEWREVLGNGGRPVPVAVVEAGLKELFPSNFLNFEKRRAMQTYSFDLTRKGMHAGPNKRRDELNERFGLAHLRHDLGSDTAMTDGTTAATDDDDQDEAAYVEGPRVFDPSPRASFLPHMIALARENGIRLHFHRVKRRPRGASPQSEWLMRYMSDLEQWLKANGCVFTDETGDPALPLSMYADGDHISGDPTVQARYRDLFVTRVRPFIGDKTANAAAP